MSRRTSAALVLLGLVLLSVNLRPAAVSIGPVLSEIRTDLRMSAASAGLLTSLPVLAFAGFGALAPWAARKTGVHRLTLLALLALVAGLLGRSMTGSEVVFHALSLLALGGAAMANVLMPSLVRLHFPNRVGPVTAVYTTAMAIGLTAAFVLTVPIAEATNGWRWGLGAWALVAVVAVLPWLGLLRHDEALPPGARTVRFLDVARTPIGLAMVLFFGFQSLQAYAVFGWFATLWRDAGFTAAEAGALLGLVAGVSIPLSLLVPTLAARRDNQRGLVIALMACYPVGYVGLMVAPSSLALVWAALVGIGLCAFPLVLTMIALKARTPQATAALSGVTQSMGYLIAVAGPFLVGLLNSATGGWTAPLILLLALVVPQLLAGLYAARPLVLEDQLAMRTGTA